jgi:hypothetical protein
MKKTKAETKRKLIAELVQIEKRSEYLSTRFDEISMELRDIEEKRRVISSRKQVVVAELEQLGVKV